MPNKITVADFFCGAGGFSEGFRQEGFDVVFALDNWKPAIDTHELNHPECKASLTDILTLDTPKKIDEAIPDVDVIIGSPPCVSFSGSNKAGKADKSLGIQLIEAYLRIVLWKKSKGKLKHWIMENVPNSSKYTQDTYTWKELGLPGNGPDLTIKQKEILDAANYGAPQNRLRFVCGDYPLPEKTHNEKQWTTYKDVFKSLGNPMLSPTKKISDPNYDLKINANRLTDHYYDTRIEEFEWKRAKQLKKDHGFMGIMSFPEKLERPSRTVMATMSASTRESMIFDSTDSSGKHIGYRLPTIREISTFMSFPVNYQFEGKSESNKYRLVGNAVCPKLSAALAKSIAKLENKPPPSAFVKLPNNVPEYNLNGTKRKKKTEKPRKFESKFQRHIPYMKIIGMRVQLSNKESKFEKNRIKWTSRIHYGPPKKHREQEIDNAKIEKHIESYKTLTDTNFSQLKKDSLKEFSKAPSSSEFHRRYIMREDKELCPDTSIELVKKIVDKTFPADKFQQTSVPDSKKLIKGHRVDIPIRVLAALYVTNILVSQIESQD